MKYADTILQEHQKYLNLVLLSAEDMDSTGHRTNNGFYKEGNRSFYHNKESVVGYRYAKTISLCIDHENE